MARLCGRYHMCMPGVGFHGGGKEGKAFESARASVDDVFIYRTGQQAAGVATRERE